MKNTNRKKENSGVSLYFAILILSVLMSSLLALISISIGQIKVIWAVGDSIKAFYSADAGIEQALFRMRQQENFNNFSGSLDDVSYDVSIVVGEEVVVKSVGLFRETRRAIETRY